MLSAQNKVKKDQINAEEKRKLLDQFETRLQGYISRLDAYHAYFIVEREEINEKIKNLRSILDYLSGRRNYGTMLCTYTNERMLTGLCEHYDQVMQSITSRVRDVQTKKDLHSQFSQRLKGYKGSLLNYMNMCSLRGDGTFNTVEIDEVEQRRIVGHIDNLEAVLRMLEDHAVPLYTDETTLNADCEYFDKLIPSLQPKIQEAMALRASLRNQFEARINEYIEHLGKMKPSQVRDHYKSELLQDRNSLCSTNYRMIDKDKLEAFFKDVEKRFGVPTKGHTVKSGVELRRFQ